MILSGKTLKALDTIGNGILSPFLHEKTIFKETGTSGGVSIAGYDIHLADVDKGFSNKEKHFGRTLWYDLKPHQFILGVSLEEFDVPNDVMGFVHNKSSDARKGLLQVTGVLEPGWKGYLTLEMFNMHPQDTYRMYEGQPIAQVVFHQIDEDLLDSEAYIGKYQQQPQSPTHALMEVTTAL